MTARWRFRAGLPVAVVVALLALPATSPAADLHATPANLGSVFASSQGGDVIHLATGSYGTFSGGSKPATVTLVPEPGASASMGLGFTPADHIRLDGLTLSGGALTGAHDIAIVNSTFTATTNISASVPNANIVLDHDVFDNISPCGSCPEGRVTVTSPGGNSAGPSGVVISNSRFFGGTSDGVQLTGQATGVQIGPGNEFANMGQTSAVHTDPIQLYGARDTLITGNYLHDNATGIMAPDGGDGGYLRIENNVFTRSEQPGAYLGFKPGLSVIHNTFTVALMINDDPSKSGSPTTGAVIKDNVLGGGLAKQNLGSGAIAQEDYNLLSGGSGAHDIKANPTFAAGAKPTTYAGFLLAPGSPGVKAADDGADMGILPAPPPPPAAAAPAPAARAPKRGSADSAGPSISLGSPAPGSLFGSRMRLSARVADRSGVDRVGFWLDRRWIGTDRAAPYKMSWRTRRGTAFRTHTVTVRAFGGDGQVSSLGVTVRRVHHVSARGARAGTRRGWRLTTKPAANGTALRGRGIPRHKVRVYLTRCADPSARVSRKLRLRADRKGAIRATNGARNLCVLRLQPV